MAEINEYLVNNLILATNTAKFYLHSVKTFISFKFYLSNLMNRYIYIQQYHENCYFTKSSIFISMNLNGFFPWFVKSFSAYSSIFQYVLSKCAIDLCTYVICFPNTYIFRRYSCLEYNNILFVTMVEINDCMNC